MTGWSDRTTATPADAWSEPLGDAPPPTSEEHLEEYLSRPTHGVVETLRGLDGDLLVLGAGGKLGLSVTSMAARALRALGSPAQVVAVSRFRDGAAGFEAAGVRTIAADLLDERDVADLPDAPWVLLLAGMKFGSSSDQPLTWAMNTLLPALVARRFKGARIVALSTGNVYPFVGLGSGGSTEEDPPSPIGEYALTCLGRERILTYLSTANATRTTLVRLNYANALRYGVLVDIALKVRSGEPVDLTMGSANVIWQGDANAAILRAFEIAASPPAILNVAGPETMSIRWAATRLAELMGTEAHFTGEAADTALLSNASRLHALFGYPRVTLDRMVSWTAAWVGGGMPLLSKPTGFQTRDGRF